MTGSGEALLFLVALLLWALILACRTTTLPSMQPVLWALIGSRQNPATTSQSSAATSVMACLLLQVCEWQHGRPFMHILITIIRLQCWELQVTCH